MMSSRKNRRTPTRKNRRPTRRLRPNRRRAERSLPYSSSSILLTPIIDTCYDAVRIVYEDLFQRVDFFHQRRKEPIELTHGLSRRVYTGGFHYAFQLSSFMSATDAPQIDSRRFSAKEKPNQ